MIYISHIFQSSTLADSFDAISSEANNKLSKLDGTLRLYIYEQEVHQYDSANSLEKHR